MKPAAPTRWENRIIGHGELPAGEISANPRNWRVHPDFQKDALSGALDEIGWIDEVTINKHSGLVVDGHLRVTLALLRSPAEPVPVRYVDLTPAQELTALATKDPITGLAMSDDQKLADLLLEVETDDAHLQQLLDELAISAEMSAAIAGEPPAAPPDLGDKNRQVKVVLRMQELALFEAAILMTGIPNRGLALAHICEVFINAEG